MSGISSKALNFGSPENKKKYNGIEYENSFDVNIGEAFFRTHDPQLGRWWQLDPKPNEFESLYAAMGNNPILKADPLGDTSVYYNSAGKEIYRLTDGSKRITPSIVSDDKMGAFNDATKDGATVKELKGLVTTYDTKAFSKFYTDNKSKFKANKVGDIDLTSEYISKVTVNGKKVDKNSLKAEATGNTVLKDGVVTVGNNPAKSANSMSTSVQDAGDEPGRVGSIHLHMTAAAKTTVEAEYRYGAIKGVNLYGGSPSPGDHTEHSRSSKQSGSQVRSVMVDDKYIYIYNSNADQTIKIPRL